MAEDKKLMDVAKPGTTAPQTGSKPMVIGHKSMANDPSVSTDIEQKDSAEAPSKKKITLSPIGDESKENSTDEVSTNEEEVTTKQSNEENSEKKLGSTKLEVKRELTVQPPESNPADKVETKKDDDVKPLAQDTVQEGTKDKSDTENDEEETEAPKNPDDTPPNEARLQELIDTKKYFVPIKESKSSGSNSFVVAFAITVVIAVVVLLLLADAEILDLGFNAPTDFL